MVAKKVKSNSCGAKLNLKAAQEGGKTHETKGPGKRGQGTRIRIQKEDEE